MRSIPWLNHRPSFSKCSIPRPACCSFFFNDPIPSRMDSFASFFFSIKHHQIHRDAAASWSCANIHWHLKPSGKKSMESSLTSQWAVDLMPATRVILTHCYCHLWPRSFLLVFVSACDHLLAKKTSTHARRSLLSFSRICIVKLIDQLHVRFLWFCHNLGHQKIIPRLGHRHRSC